MTLEEKKIETTKELIDYFHQESFPKHLEEFVEKITDFFESKGLIIINPTVTKINTINQFWKLIKELEPIKSVPAETLVSQPSELTCEWKAQKRLIAEHDGLHDGYKTNCGYTISDSYIIGAPHYKYCAFCGKLIHEQP